MQTNSIKEKIISYGVPVILVLVAVSQIITVQMTDLSPWKRGGFGMFSTVDNSYARFLRIYVVIGDQEYPVDYADLSNISTRRWDDLRALPTKSKVDNIVEQLANEDWFVRSSENSSIEYIIPEDRSTEDTEPIRIDGVRVEVWRFTFDSQRETLVASQILSAEQTPAR